MTHRKHRQTFRKKKTNTKNFLSKSVSVAKITSKKYMPKIKSGLENVGNKVIKTGQQSIPFLQNLTRKFFGLFSKTKKHRK